MITHAQYGYTGMRHHQTTNSTTFQLIGIQLDATFQMYRSYLGYWHMFKEV